PLSVNSVPESLASPGSQTWPRCRPRPRAGLLFEGRSPHYRAVCEHWPGIPITLRQGAFVGRRCSPPSAMVFVSAELSRGRGERRSPAPRVALRRRARARSPVPCACSSADRAGLFDLLGLRPLADDELVLHGVTRSRRKRPRRRCRPTSSLGRSDRPLALLLSALFACSETRLSRLLVASQPVRICCFAPSICSSLPFGNRAEGFEDLRSPQVQNFDLSQRFWLTGPVGRANFWRR